MLVIGSKPEYFTAVWVKNEWSRYLKLMKADRSKLLIPCYKDMDAYELPEEFAHLQAQDMGKIGFINDIVRGIKKVIKKDEPKSAVKETAAAGQAANSGVAPLLKRISLFLEDGNWQEADEYCERVLDSDPENAQAYLYKLMAKIKVKKVEQLEYKAEPFDKEETYQKVIRFADEELKNKLNGYIKCINDRNEKAYLEKSEKIYQQAMYQLQFADVPDDYLKINDMFNSIRDYKDSQEKMAMCFDNIKEYYYRIANKKQNSKNYADWKEALNMYQNMLDYKESGSRFKACQKKIQSYNRRKDRTRHIFIIIALLFGIGWIGFMILGATGALRGVRLNFLCSLVMSHFMALGG